MELGFQVRSLIRAVSEVSKNTWPAGQLSVEILTNNSIKNIIELTDVFCNMITTLTESLIKLRKSFILSITFVHIAWIYFHIGVFPPLILLHIRTIPLFWNPQICILYSNITMYYTKSLQSNLIIWHTIVWNKSLVWNNFQFTKWTTK